MATAAEAAIFTGTLTGNFNINLLRGVATGPSLRVEFSADLSDASGLFLTLEQQVFRLPPDYREDSYEIYSDLTPLLTDDGVSTTLHASRSCCSMITRPSGLFLEGRTDTPIEYRLSVTAVPEPAGWALLIAGFGGAGVMLRARREQALAA